MRLHVDILKSGRAGPPVGKGVQSKWLREQKRARTARSRIDREFFLALDMLEKERGIKKEYMLEKISQALATAYKRDHEGVGDNIAGASPTRSTTSCAW